MDINDIRRENAYDLAKRAECGVPDHLDSPGAELLQMVCDDVLSRWESGDWSEGAKHEIADSAPDVYTVRRWAEFVDLAAYQETPDISGEWPDDLTEAAGFALYQIAERLIASLVDDLEAMTADEGEGDEDDE